ncbi:hypothetical protein NQ317_012125 [Molorchus minor]|uniref:Tc1-like transposase DDE domain-containing protein n=1 Tax=Molorchus minor TaxID=1323400 RepID=A0ABQ9K3V8_9CUCU|nr:hypothetical protein NQ317_012125 [Molorchus minor]
MLPLTDADAKGIILDDEKYFTLANSEMKGNDGFYTNNLEECPDNVKGTRQRGHNRGISRPFVGRVRGEALNSQGYIENCLSKLLQFVQEHHAEDDIMFWPDLASCHYSRDTQNWFQHRIPFVPKNANPPNLPQARPIEDFWALLSRKVYHRGWEAQNEQQLRRRIFEKLREIDLNSVQGLMRDIRRKLRLVEDGIVKPKKEVNVLHRAAQVKVMLQDYIHTTEVYRDVHAKTKLHQKFPNAFSPVTVLRMLLVFRILSLNPHPLPSRNQNLDY